MSSTTPTVRDSLESLTKDEIETPLTDMNKTQELLQFTKKCAEMKRTEQSVMILQAEINEDINECHQQESRCRLLQLQLVEAVRAGKLYDVNDTISECLVHIRTTFLDSLKVLRVKFEEGSQKLKEWDVLAPLRLPSLDWAKKMIREDPDGLLKQMEECKTKVDAAHKFFQELKEEVKSSKEGMQLYIGIAIHLSEGLMHISQMDA